MENAPEEPEHQPPAGAVTLELTPEQRRAIRDATGIELSRLAYSRIEAAGVSLLAAAVEAGHTSPASARLVAFELTPAQLEEVTAAVGGGIPARWVVDVDHTTVRYGEDWTRTEPTPLGERGLVVVGSTPIPEDDRLLVRLPTGLEDVFGTGRHNATRLAADLLEEHLAAGDEVIDVGTGSGILAVFAVRLGARHVRAVDTSAAAIEAATRTVELNACKREIDLVLGELDAGGPPADLVVANILAGVLLDLLPTLAAAVRPGGHLVTSGVVEARGDEIAAAAASLGLVSRSSRTAGGWVATAFQSG